MVYGNNLYGNNVLGSESRSELLVESSFDTVIKNEDIDHSSTFDTVIKNFDAEKNFTTDTSIVQQNDVTITNDALIVNIDGETSYPIDAVVEEKNQRSLDIDSVIIDQKDLSATFDTAILSETEASSTFDLTVQEKNIDVSTSFDTVLKNNNQEIAFTTDARLVERKTQTGTLDTVIAFGKEDSFTAVIEGKSYTGVMNVDIETQLNELHTFTFDAFIEDDADRQQIQEGKEVLLFDETQLIFKGELEDVNYDSTFKAECEGTGQKLSLLKRKTGRKEYINERADDIIRDLLGDNDDIVLGTVEQAPVITIRVDHDNELRAAAGVANAVGYDLFAENRITDDYDTTYVNFVEHKGSKSSVATLNIAEELRLVSRGRDKTAVANDITILGRGDGINQIETRLFAATTHRTVTTQRIQAGDTTTLGVNDATQLGSVGDEVDVRVGEEVVNASIQDSTTLDILGRGQQDYKGDSTKDSQHYEDIQVFLKENKTQGIGPFKPNRDDAEAGSSIDNFGVIEERDTDKTLIDRATVEKVADNELKDRRKPVFRVEVDLTDPRGLQDLGIKIGDQVTIEDLTAPDVSNDFRVVGIDYKRASAGEATTLHCANRPVRLIERLSKIERDRDTLNAHMQGATNFNGESFEDNCDADHSLSNKIFVPEDVVEVNKFELTFTRESFRGYVQQQAHSHEVNPIVNQQTGERALQHSHNIDKIPDHAHDISVTTPSAAGDADTEISEYQLIPYSSSHVETLDAPLVSGDGGYLLVFWNLANSGNNSGPFEGTRTIRNQDTGEVIVDDTSSVLYYVGDNNVLMAAYVDSSDVEGDTIEFEWDGNGGTGDMVWNYGAITVGDHEHSISDKTNTQNTPSTTETSQAALGSSSSSANSGVPTYGIFEPDTESDVDVEVKVDGNTVTTITDVSVGQEVSTPIDLTGALSDPVAGSYHTIELVPTGRCRISADVVQKVFIESKL